MPMTTTRSKSQRSESLVLNPGLNVAKGRGKTPLKVVKTSTGDSRGSLTASNSGTSTRAIRSSPVSVSSDTCVQPDSDEAIVIEHSTGGAPLETSLQEAQLQFSGSLTEDRKLEENQEYPDISGRMATNQDSSEHRPSTSRGMDNMEALMTYLQEAMRETREEFRQELNSIRDAIGHPQNDRPFSATTNTQASALSNTSSALQIRLKDWKVSYSGEGNVSDFLFKIETLTERSQCSYDHLLANFHMFLTHKAETWYWLFIKQNPRASYASLKAGLISEFGTLETESEILLKISTRKQLAKENYDDFHAYIVQMNSRLRNPMSDASLIEIIKKNVNPDLRIMLFISEPKDLGVLRLLAKKAEKILHESKPTAQPLGKMRRVDEISVENTPQPDSDDEHDPQVEAFRISRPYTKGDYSKIKCWNCLKLGHSYIYCPDETRRIFCYKCGKKDVTTPKCSEPHTENRRRSGQQTGDVRSSN